jgi:hypothetical protein
MTSRIPKTELAGSKDSLLIHPVRDLNAKLGTVLSVFVHPSLPLI